MAGQRVGRTRRDASPPYSSLTASTPLSRPAGRLSGPTEGTKRATGVARWQHKSISAKERISVKVDAELVRFGNQVVADGRAESLSSWVNTALRAALERDEKLRAMDAVIAEYEAEHGEITEADMIAAERELQARAIHVRPR